MPKTRIPLSAELRDLVTSRADELRRLPDAAVATLPVAAPETLPDGKTVVTVYCHSLPDGGYRVVVQGGRPLLFGMYTAIEVDGFVLLPNGTRRALTEEETWDFI